MLSPAASATTAHPTRRLGEAFAALGGSWEGVEREFHRHFRGGYLAELISQELGALARNPEHTVNTGVNQYTLTPVSLPGLEYSVRIIAPFANRPHVLKWLGMRQIIGVKGRGTVTVRKLRAPTGTRIERFTPGVVMEVAETAELRHLESVVAEDRTELLDIVAVSEPSVLEILTFKADAGATIWTFDEKLTSVYAEQSLPVVSRFRNVVNLAVAMGREVPNDIYQRALQSDNAHLALAALEELLVQGGQEAFEALHGAIEAENSEVREGAGRLLGLLTNAGRESRAA